MVERPFAAAVAMLQARPPHGNARVATVRSGHGAVLLQFGGAGAARALLERSVQTLPSTPGPGHRAAREAQQRPQALERVVRRTSG